MTVNPNYQNYLLALSHLNQGVQGQDYDSESLMKGFHLLTELFPYRVPNEGDDWSQKINQIAHLLPLQDESAAEAFRRFSSETTDLPLDEYRGPDPIRNLRHLISSPSPAAHRTAFVNPLAEPTGDPQPSRLGVIVDPTIAGPSAPTIIFQRIPPSRETPLQPAKIKLPSSDTDQDGYLHIILKDREGHDSIVKSPYRILRKLGSGATADVFLASDISTGNLVAIKRIKPSVSTQYLLEMFEKEQKIQGKIKDKSHLVEVYSAGRTALNLPFIVLEFTPYGDLESYFTQIKAGNYLHSLKQSPNLTDQEKLNKARLEKLLELTAAIEKLETETDRDFEKEEMLGKLRRAFEEIREQIHLTKGSLMKRFDGEIWSLDWAITMGAEIISAAVAFDESGFVHRDIKPSNIFLAQQRKGVLPKIADLGGMVAQDYPQPYPFGTPAYMSPEAYQEKYPARTGQDIFSLALVLWELMTLDHPLKTASIAEVFRESQDLYFSGRSPSRESCFHKVPDLLDNIILKSLHPDPSQRFSSAHELLVRWVSAEGDYDVKQAVQTSTNAQRKKFLNQALGKYITAHNKWPLPELKKKIASTAMLLWNMADEQGDLASMDQVSVLIDTHDEEGSYRQRIHAPITYRFVLDSPLSPHTSVHASITTQEVTLVDGKAVISPTKNTRAIFLEGLHSCPRGSVYTLNLQITDSAHSRHLMYPISIPLPTRPRDDGMPHEIRIPYYPIEAIPRGFCVIPAGEAIILNEGDGKGMFGKITPAHRKRVVKHDFAIGPKINNYDCFLWLQKLAILVRERKMDAELFYAKFPSHWDASIKNIFEQFIASPDQFIPYGVVTLTDIDNRPLSWRAPVTHLSHDTGLELMQALYPGSRYPTPPEWTMACIGSDSLRRFSWGDADNPTGEVSPQEGSFAWQLGHFAPDRIPDNFDISSPNIPWDMSPYSPQNKDGYLAGVAFLMSGTYVYLVNFNKRYFYKKQDAFEAIKENPDSFDQWKIKYRLVGGRPYTEGPARRDVLDYLTTSHAIVGLIPLIPLHEVPIPGDA